MISYTMGHKYGRRTELIYNLCVFNKTIILLAVDIYFLSFSVQLNGMLL